ncbi:MAG: VWA domain-containing protein [Candidatus Coatesbacteria bacterium]|nr:VWA domain-containing protein [Candidatus Coatesbacteria bacterium]
MTTKIILLIIMLTSMLLAKSENTITEGSLITTDQSGKTYNLPLKHTSVKGRISGFISEVNVTQQFENPYDKTIEAVYVFPLPHTAAVNQMTMKIGDRIIKGVIKKREEAKQIYENAKRQGKTTSLLEQERANIFTQSVANIHPGDKIEIIITYFYALPYEDGNYTFEFPMVVGPRYIPAGQPDMITSSDPKYIPTTSESQKGHGWGKDNNRVPDASRITPQYLKPSERSSHDIDVEIELDAGMPVEGFKSINHKIQKEEQTDGKMRVILANDDKIPNKDFIIKYSTAGDKLKTACLSAFDGKEGYFMLIVQPKKDYKSSEYIPRDLIFLVDASGSMSGSPIEQSKAVMRSSISKMHPKDRFQIIVFANEPVSMSKGLLENTKYNREKALEYINSIHGSGGTEMLKGVQAALSVQKHPRRRAFIFLLTDGYIGNESEIISATKSNISDARMFVLGVGSSVNKAFLDDVSEAGKGKTEYISLNEKPEEAAEKFYKSIGNPVLMDIQVDFRNRIVFDKYPSIIPDLFKDQPIVLFGRYTKPGETNIRIKGRIGASPYSQELDVVLNDSNTHPSISSIWARNAIQYKDRMMQKNIGDRNKLTSEITDLALKYRLMSAFTSFVAVEEQIRRDTNGEIITVPIPVPMPDGVSYKGVFGEEGECDDECKESYGRTSTGAGMSYMKKSSALPYVSKPASREICKIETSISQNQKIKDTDKSQRASCLISNIQVSNLKIFDNLSNSLSNENEKTKMQTLINRNIIKLRNLLNKWAVKNTQNLNCKISVTVSIGADGQIKVSTISNKLPATLVKLIENEIKKWKFASIKTDSKVSFQIEIN